MVDGVVCLAELGQRNGDEQLCLRVGDTDPCCLFECCPRRATANVSPRYPVGSFMERPNRNTACKEVLVMAVTIELRANRKVCLADGCSKPAQFMIQRDDWPQMLYCGNDLAQRVELYREQGREITCSDEARLALKCLGLEEVFL